MKKLASTVEIDGNDEVRVSCVWEEGGGRTNYIVKIAWTRACVKARLSNHLISKNACMLNAILFSEDTCSMSTY